MVLFYKYNGAGNDFVLFEDKVPLPVIALCDRKRGIGADGVLLIQRKSPSHFQMTIFNKDGSEAEMCGNGLRAVFSHLYYRFPQEAPYTVQSNHSNHVGFISEDGEISIQMGQPIIHAIKRNFSSYLCDYVDTGVPHLVLNRTSSLKDFLDIAPLLRHHPELPKGANVNYLEKIEGHWKVSTYERGVEGITEACGTGVVASALSLALHEKLQSPISLLTPGGDRLTVAFEGAPEEAKNLTLKGATTLVFEGTLFSSIMNH